MVRPGRRRRSPPPSRGAASLGRPGASGAAGALQRAEHGLVLRPGVLFPAGPLREVGGELEVEAQGHPGVHGGVADLPRAELGGAPLGERDAAVLVHHIAEEDMGSLLERAAVAAVVPGVASLVPEGGRPGEALHVHNVPVEVDTPERWVRVPQTLHILVHAEARDRTSGADQHVPDRLRQRRTNSAELEDVDTAGARERELEHVDPGLAVREGAPLSVQGHERRLGCVLL
mmetsp:Transcript_71169/g.201676  ORF Transcript_71169/g.201676 Transcript_71169/m.201676 type:complete len:231 (-) Transcript_71169:225-917(-)